MEFRLVKLFNGRTAVQITNQQQFHTPIDDWQSLKIASIIFIFKKNCHFFCLNLIFERKKNHHLSTIINQRPRTNRKYHCDQHIDFRNIFNSFRLILNTNQSIVFISFLILSEKKNNKISKETIASTMSYIDQQVFYVIQLQSFDRQIVESFFKFPTPNCGLFNTKKKKEANQQQFKRFDRWL